MARKVLVVDDDPDIPILIKTLLETNGYDVITVSSGKECIDELKKGFRGIILMDSMMPVMDGPDTIKNIVNENLAEGNIILMLTSRDEPDERLDEVKQYVVDYLAKPADVENLPDILKGYSEFLKEE